MCVLRILAEILDRPRVDTGLEVVAVLPSGYVFLKSIYTIWFSIQMSHFLQWKKKKSCILGIFSPFVEVPAVLGVSQNI